MKKMSKLLALLLALAMVFSLVACSDSDKDDGDKKGNKEVKLESEWVFQANMSDYIAETLADELGDSSLAPNKAFYMNVTFNFEDGKFTMSAEPDKKSSEAYMDALADNMVDYMVDNSGMSKEELEEEAKDNTGMSLKEYVESVMDDALEAIFEQASFELDSLCYQDDADEGRILVAEDEDDLEDSNMYIEYTLKDGKLTVKNMVGFDDVLEETELGEVAEFPWVFEQK